MSPFNIPGLDGIKTIVGSWTQIICGLLLAVVQLLQGINDCLQGVSPLDVCFDTLPTLLIGVIVAANGLGQLGIGHKIEKATK